MVRSIGGALSRAKSWWRCRPLGTVFVVYLASYLAIATAGTAAILTFVDARQSIYMTVEVDAGSGEPQRAIVESGPYIYDEAADELIPATEIDLPGDNPYAVFVGVKHDVEPDRSGLDASEIAELEELEEGGYPEVDATMGLVRSGKVELYDWGLNYNNDPGFTSEEILDDRGAIAADRVGAYDRRNRAGRVDAVGLFESATGVDLAQAFGDNMVSNVAYYADSQPSEGFGVVPYALNLMLNVVAPIALYGGLAWAMFRRFYRLHIAGPLDSLACDARRIAGRDLDFEIEPVRGRELGALSLTLEDMRSSLLDAQRELWRTAEERRRLNAAFAHDLRTPVTVLKGTVEMACLRARRGEAPDADVLDTLGRQVGRLESYANAMGGLSKLEDRVVEREPARYAVVADDLVEQARDLVAARRPDLVVEPSVTGSDGELRLDRSLVGEVLGNNVGNACVHASRRVGVEVERVSDGEGEWLVVRVRDDGSGFTPEALRRGCDPFFSENKSAEHFGLGLNISSMLARLHGGGLELGNDDAGGACVTARFSCTDEG